MIRVKIKGPTFHILQYYFVLKLVTNLLKFIKAYNIRKEFHKENNGDVAFSPKTTNFEKITKTCFFFFFYKNQNSKNYIDIMTENIH